MTCLPPALPLSVTMWRSFAKISPPVLEFGWTEQIPSAGSWAGPRQLWQLAEESPQFQLSHYYPGPQVELLGGKVGTFSPNCQLFPPLLSNLSVLVTLFYLTRGFVNMKRWRPKKKFELVHKDKIFVPSVLSCLHVPTSDHYSVNSVPNF